MNIRRFRLPIAIFLLILSPCVYFIYLHNTDRGFVDKVFKSISERRMAFLPTFNKNMFVDFDNLTTNDLLEDVLKKADIEPSAENKQEYWGKVMNFPTSIKNYSYISSSDGIAEYSDNKPETTMQYKIEAFDGNYIATIIIVNDKNTRKLAMISCVKN